MSSSDSIIRFNNSARCSAPPASRYYAWRVAQVRGTMGKSEPAWETEVVTIFDHHKRRYDTRRLQVELRELGHRVGRQALRTGLRRHGRKALQPKSFVPRTTDSTHGQRCALNLLLDQPKPTQANRMWVSDIICLPLASGAWAYLCAFQSVGAKHVVGWQVRADMPEALVTTFLQRALLAQRLAPGLIIHSGRGRTGVLCSKGRIYTISIQPSDLKMLAT